MDHFREFFVSAWGVAVVILLLNILTELKAIRSVL